MRIPYGTQKDGYILKRMLLVRHIGWTTQKLPPLSTPATLVNTTLSGSTVGSSDKYIGINLFLPAVSWQINFNTTYSTDLSASVNIIWNMSTSRETNDADVTRIFISNPTFVAIVAG